MAAPTGSSTRQRNIETILTDPISLELMQNAVLLAPCGHSVEESSAVRMFGKIKYKEASFQPFVDIPVTCPICRLAVIKYYPNKSFQSLMRDLNLQQGQTSTETVEMVRERVIEKVKSLVDMPYPGKHGHFIISQKAGQRPRVYPTGTREITFESITEDSFVKKFRITLNADGSTKIDCYFSEKYRNKVDGYLKFYQLRHPLAESLSFYSRDSLSTKKIFELLAKNNEIPDYGYYRSLIEASDWRDAYITADGEAPLVRKRTTYQASAAEPSSKTAEDTDPHLGSLKDPVLLAPCGDTVDRKVAKCLYGKVVVEYKLNFSLFINYKVSTENPGSCPICSAKVAAYYSNRAQKALLDECDYGKIPLSCLQMEEQSVPPSTTSHPMDCE